MKNIIERKTTIGSMNHRFTNVTNVHTFSISCMDLIMSSIFLPCIKTVQSVGNVICGSRVNILISVYAIGRHSCRCRSGGIIILPGRRNIVFLEPDLALKDCVANAFTQLTDQHIIGVITRTSNTSTARGKTTTRGMKATAWTIVAATTSSREGAMTTI